MTARIDLATSLYRQRKLEDAETEAKPGPGARTPQQRAWHYSRTSVWHKAAPTMRSKLYRQAQAVADTPQVVVSLHGR